MTLHSSLSLSSLSDLCAQGSSALSYINGLTLELISIVKVGLPRLQAARAVMSIVSVSFFSLSLGS